MNLSFKDYKILTEVTPETFPYVKAKPSCSSISFASSSSSSSASAIFGHTPRNLSEITKQETKLKARSMVSRGRFSK